ncbi:MAG: carboxypeptidase-like regulatory domain-containing protein [Bacteroidales bacterium]|nr:MAG: carboxypeptidase-like regulatory domain-containing protein [Bacteroidales bacterium]
MSKGFIFLISVLIQISYGYSQEYGVLKGRITDDKGNPVLGATIVDEDNNIGTITGERGYFELNLPADADITVTISFIGYEKISIPVKIGAGETYEINRSLVAKSEEIEEVLIESKFDRVGTLERIDIKSIDYLPTTTGGVESILGTLGASIRSEFSSQYSVRGGNFDENLVYVNGIEIYRPLLVKAGQQEGLSFINSSMVSSIQFSAGGFDAQYGDKMSSVLDIKYRRPARFGGGFSASLLGGSVYIEGSSKNNRFTHISGLRYKSNQYLLSNLETKGDYKPSFLDFQTYLTYDISKSFEISLLGNIARNKYNVVPQTRETAFGTYQQTVSFNIYYDGQELDNFITYLGAISFDYHPSKKLSLKLTGSGFNTYENVTYDIQGQYLINLLDNVVDSETFGDSILNIGIGTYLQHARNYLDAYVFSVSHKGTYYTDNNNLKWGIKFQVEDIQDKIVEWDMIDSVGYSVPYSDTEVRMARSTRSRNNLYSKRLTSFIQNTFYFWSGNSELYLNAGIRAHYWTINDQLVISPRAILSFDPNWNRDIQFHLAAGYYFQPPFYKELRDPEGVLYKDIKAQKSIHYVLGSDINFTAWERPFIFSTEIYYKYLFNLVPYKIDDVDIQYLPQYFARGYAVGIEFKINGEFVKDADSWATLSIMQTKEDIYQDYYIKPDKTVVLPGYYPRPTNQLLSFGLFFQDYFPNNPDYKVHLNFFYGSRLPYGSPEYNRPHEVYEMKAYKRVDIGMSKSLLRSKLVAGDTGFFRRFKSIWLNVEIFNLLGVQNQISYQWIRTIKNQFGLPNLFAVPNYLTGRTFNMKINARF